MNLKSKNGKKILRNASMIGVGLFVVGAGVGVITSSSQAGNGQRPKIQRQGVVEKSVSNISSSSVSSSKTMTVKKESRKVVSASSSNSSSSFSSSASSSSNTSTASSSDSDKSSSVKSTDMPNTAAIQKTYSVVRGDSLWSISQALHKSFAELLVKNPSANPDHIEAGEVINL